MQYKNPFHSWSPTASNSSSMQQMWKGYSKALTRTWCLNWRNGAQSLLCTRGVHEVSRIWRRFIPAAKARLIWLLAVLWISLVALVSPLTSVYNGIRCIETRNATWYSFVCHKHVLWIHFKQSREKQSSKTIPEYKQDKNKQCKIKILYTVTGRKYLTPFDCSYLPPSQYRHQHIAGSFDWQNY